MELLEDWRWMPDFKRWSLLLRLTVNNPGSNRIAESTDWYYLVEPDYPLGSISVNPAETNGIKHTFHHQRCNRSSQSGAPWRRGNICVDTGVRGLDRYVQNQEPWSIHRRLRWYVQRTLAWLDAAASNELMLVGEPFELPDFPLTPDSMLAVAFNEDAATYAAWQSSTKRVGYFEYTEPSSIRHTVLVQRFLTGGNRVLVETPWSDAYKVRRPGMQRGVWIRLPGLPVIEPWQAPTTWGELETACAAVGIDISSLLERASHLVRNGKKNLGLLGFPIPRNTGDQPIQMHWQAFYFPALAYRHKHPKGFRPLPMNQWRLDRQQALALSNSIEWLDISNWGADEISARGRLPEDVRSTSFAMIGAGALGSAVAELLTRAGVADLLIIDSDALEVGNLVRHTLTMNDLYQKKAVGVASRLNTISPNLRVKSLATDFPPSDERDLERLSGIKVVIDTTGSDEVIAALSEQEWPEPKLMISVSLSLGAKRLYVFAAHCERFPFEEFHQRVDPLLKRDADEWEESGIPWEGIGCWHPVFPARIDDVWLLASAAIKEIESVVSRPPMGIKFSIFEQIDTEDGFNGLRKL